MPRITKCHQKNHRKKKKLRRTNGKRCKNWKLPANVCYEKFSFRNRPEKGRRTMEMVRGNGIAMCTVCASVSAVNGFECGQRKAEKFRKVPIKDKPMEMDAFCSSLASPFRRRVGLTNGGAEWREVPAKDTSESGKKVSTASNRVIPSGCV